MSLHLPASSTSLDPDTHSDSDSSSSSEEEDQTWDDWLSDSVPCQSLFNPDKKLASAEDALAYDNATYGFDLNQICSRISLDFHGRIRLINYIRKTKPSPDSLINLTGTEPFLSSDEYLIPVLEDDPLLQLDASNDWSDSEDEEEQSTDPSRRIIALEKKLAKAKQDLIDYHKFVSDQMNVSSLVQAINDPSSSELSPATRDDDSHYFESYAANDIHAVMIQDKVRTSTYASFILTNPSLFRDAVVLDVGCGTGILSLFAARGGAKRVFAVDASDIAEKAEKIVKANGLENVITVIRGKIEDITLPDGITQVDIIISEWMGYALLYESMLDSVLRARDRFLRPDGVMAPSQCQMMLGLCDGSEVFKDRVDFWNDVYGFDLSTMAEDLYAEAIVDVVGPETMLSAPYVIKDLHLNEITPRQLDFSSPFTLVSTADRKTKINTLILYFDTFFTVSGHVVPPETEVSVIKEGDVILAEVWPVGNKPPPQRRKSQSQGDALKEKITSFSTGPKSIPTHWKQTLFFLREPITVEEGSIVSGTFHCRKSETNSRELDVEIHYSVKESPDAQPTDIVVQMYKVR